MTGIRFSAMVSGQRPAEWADAFRQVAAIGFDGIELHLSRLDDEPDAIVRQLEMARLTPAIVGTIGHAFGPLLRRERTAEEVRESFRPLARLARLGGAGRMHYCCWMEQVEPDESREAFVDRLVQRLVVLVEVCAEEGVIPCYEPAAPHAGTFGLSTAEGLAVVARVGSPALRLTFDTYQAAAVGEDPVEALRLVLPRLGHAHASDIRHTPRGVQRPLPGRGEIDFGRFLRVLAEAGYSGYCGIEGHPETPDAAAELAQSLAHLRAASRYP